VWLNGQQLTDNNWSTINWSFDDVIAYTSRGTKLAAGDILGSGTVGTGCLAEYFMSKRDSFPGWLKEGDVVTFEVDVIGRMEIKVGPAEPVHPLSSGA